MAQTKIGWRPYVSGTDADAQAFITAAAITDSTQQSAINTLVTQLKTYGIWTKLKAIYPFVGGTASSHKFNLKDPRDLDGAYRLFFGGGGTHGANGYLTNGTTAYANTFLPPNTQLTKNSTHMSMYCGNNPTPVQANPAFGATQTNGNSYYIHLKHPGDSKYHGYVGSTSNEVNFLNTDTRGFHILTRTANNVLKAYKNTSLLSTNTTTDSTNLPGQTINLGRLSTDGGWISTTENNYEHRLVSIGDGLTDTEAANFYTAVQAYQSTLNRQVP